MRIVETLTLQEAIDVMRGYKMPMSYEKLCALVDSNAVPWAVSGEHKGTTYRTVFKKPLIDWLEGLAVGA